MVENGGIVNKVNKLALNVIYFVISLSFLSLFVILLEILLLQDVVAVVVVLEIKVV